MTCENCKADTLTAHQVWGPGGFREGRRCSTCGHVQGAPVPPPAVEAPAEPAAESDGGDSVTVTEVPLEVTKGGGEGVPEAEAAAPEDTDTPERRVRKGARK